MKFAQVIPVTDWQAATEDPAALIACIPGVTAVEPIQTGLYRIQAVNGIGPVRLRLEGTARLQRPAPNQLVAEVTLQDMAGTVYGIFRLTAQSDGIALDADVTLGGRLGEFAQPLIRKRAEETVRGFQQNLMARLGSSPS
ncbi:MAG: hypothetical protein K6U14_11540 [Firmicutes bacterium]|nr:hypothetical protein [Alicyclobacillaceae bacterium]MCL6498247.1 hypothetical protein [Bacillota bacterium]